MLRRMMKDLKKQEGFTLLEVLVVIAILGIIAALITPKFVEVMKEARVDTAKAGAKQIQTGLERYNFKHNAYPTTIADHAALIAAVGSAANIPANAADSPLTIKSYVLDDPAVDAAPVGTADPAYTLTFTVTAEATRCVVVTPETIKAGNWNSTASTCTPDA